MSGRAILVTMLLVTKFRNGATTEVDGKIVHNHFYLDGEAGVSGNAKELLCSKPQVRPGPHGKRGPPGEMGPPGPPGIAADSKIFQNMESDITTMKDDIRQLKSSVPVGDKGVTLVGHDSEEDYFVHGCEPAGCYSKDIKYDIDMKTIEALISKSRFCRQYLKYHCFGSILFANQAKAPDRRAWWVSRSGNRINRWAGAKKDFTCPCADSGTCVEDFSCNCDKNDGVWRTDDGYITEKDLLPVTQLRFGDAGDGTEKGFHTLGKLECYK